MSGKVFLSIHAQDYDGGVAPAIGVHETLEAARGSILQDALEESCEALEDVRDDDGNYLFAVGNDCTVTLVEADVQESNLVHITSSIEAAIEYQQFLIDEDALNAERDDDGA